MGEEKDTITHKIFTFINNGRTIMNLSQVAKITNGKLLGNNTEFTGVSTDTRTLKPGDLFIARKGEKLDSHDFVDQIAEKQAAAIIVERPLNTTLPQIVVENSDIAFGQIAAFHRQQFNIPLVGVTGSCGKTTVKTMTASILQQCGPTLFSEGSFNNAIGMPLSLFNIKPEHQYAVIEMGTNHFGEIAYLTNISKPTVAIITNAAAAHLEGLQSVEGVSRAKGEIFQGLADDGTAIINADDTYAPYWESLVKPRKILRFGITNPADVSAKKIQLDENGKAEFTLVTPKGEIIIKLPILGMHNVNNALAASAAALAVGAPLTAIKAGLETAPGVSKRLREYQSANGARIIDDSYNANPLSFKAAIEILATQKGEKILVLGDMKELGEKSADYHHELGEIARRLVIEKLYAYGEMSQLTAKSFGAQALHFADQASLINTLKNNLNAQTTILVKGSRSMHMERVVEAIIQP